MKLCSPSALLAVVATLSLTADALHLNKLRVVIQEASGIFDSLDLTTTGTRGGNGGDGNMGKNRTLNDIIRDVSQVDDILDLEYVNLDPELPKRSTPINVKALAYVKELVDEAKARVKVTYGPFTMLNREYDLCEVLKENLNRTCPVDEGAIEVNIDVDVPGFIPWGWFHLDASAWRNSDNKQLGRILADVKF
ncbi:hypothetical protein BX661DRAFT_185449 [Kickxella alabastrina]|uniref:uncharacterized protein n=1 Tax=Kickxella alabastrina TaxID=61397 RepID=UPI00221ECDCD|nr:uncharacterized protein BX661DRAFT_185449 [Kickxella alabastrina]KAI7824507.1 hypothetical protein BX661DRAFT_185449 [Kickxella alabastrina]